MENYSATIAIGKKLRSYRWKRLEKVIIDDHIFLLIRSSVIKNVKIDAYINGVMDNKDINYHILGAGGTTVSIVFDECATSTPI